MYSDSRMSRGGYSRISRSDSGMVSWLAWVEEDGWSEAMCADEVEARKLT
jgi:hypothetical protein